MKHSKEAKMKMRLAKLGKPSGRKGMRFSMEWKKNISEAHKGYVMPEEQKEKIRAAHKGKIPKNINTIKGWNKGMRMSLSTRRKMMGANNGAWKGGITPKNIAIRMSMDYKLWREAVFARDGYACTECGTHKSPFNADHIKPFALFPELRFAIDNGRTLCVPCHRKSETYGNNSRYMTREDFIKQ